MATGQVTRHRTIPELSKNGPGTETVCYRFWTGPNREPLRFQKNTLIFYWDHLTMRRPHKGQSKLLKNYSPVEFKFYFFMYIILMDCLYEFISWWDSLIQDLLKKIWWTHGTVGRYSLWNRKPGRPNVPLLII